jgi:hypothetical protein
LRAPGQVLQWRPANVDPSGLRHWESGNYRADAKVGFVGGFDAQFESGMALDFGSVNAEDAGFLTDTIALTFNMGEVNTHVDSFFDQMVAVSSVGTNFKAFNMKFWVGDLTAFSATGVPTPIFHMAKSADWIRNKHVAPNGPGVEIVPSSLPASGNVLARSPSTVFVSGVYKDLEFSHFIYLAGEFPSGAFPLGTYGGLGQQDFTFKFSYDYTDIFANVKASDLDFC